MQVKNITAEHVFLACGHTDMRKSIDGLAAIVQQNFKLDPFSKDMFCSPSVEKIGYFPALRLVPKPVPQHTVS